MVGYVVEQGAVVELFEVGALFTKFLQEFVDDFAFLTYLLVQLVPGCRELIMAVPTEATES